MKTSKLFLAMAIALISLGSSIQAQTVDTKTSSIHWIGKKIGGQHDGYIQLKSASLEVKNNKIVGGEFVIDMSSMTCVDLEDEGYNQKLIGHLLSDDFFGVATYPTASLKITKATAFVNGKATVQADLTIKGKTESISFVVFEKGNSYTATIEVDRSKFDVRYGSNSFFDNLGDKAINDLFTLEVVLATK